MMQRYRAILHLVDPIIEAGHELTIVVSDDYVNLEKFRHTPTNAGKSAPNTLEYLKYCFGIKADLSKVNFTKNKKIKGDLHLCFDNQNKNAIGIPYNTQNCYVNGKPTLVGNPMSEEIRIRSNVTSGSVLIIHPGGGRGYVSPQRKHMSKALVTDSNIKFLQKITDNLPRWVYQVNIKTHPVPYQRCTKKALEKFVIPHLKFKKGNIEAVDNDMIGLLATHEYIINFGGTTALWMTGIGGRSKFCNIKGMNWYKASREKLISKRGGGIPIEQLKDYEWYKPENPDYGIGVKNRIMKVINESLSI